jgi:hypothetical protein
LGYDHGMTRPGSSRPSSIRGKLVVLVIFALGITLGLVLVKYRPAMPRPPATAPSTAPR